jgi:hypothetical protein
MPILANVVAQGQGKSVAFGLSLWSAQLAIHAYSVKVAGDLLLL